ncbi:MAG: SEL1-like repeat protein [Pseudomonadales bacterium]|nr:SEL1-like repeat protein [Pseudomonadales bacterium]
MSCFVTNKDGLCIINNHKCKICGFNGSNFHGIDSETKKLDYIRTCLISVEQDTVVDFVPRMLTLLSDLNNNTNENWCELAEIFSTKYFPSDDYKKLAIYCCNKAAENNDVAAIIKLANLYQKNYQQRESFNAFKKAAIDFNSAEGWFYLGELYNTRSTIYKDELKALLLNDALDCYYTSVNKGYADAAWKIYSLFLDSILQNNLLAKHWFNIAVELGATDALVQLADEYKYGKTREKNLKQAFLYYQKAAERGHMESIEQLIDFYKKGIGCRKDMGLSNFWLEQSLKFKTVDSIYSLASYYFNDKNYKKAYLYMRSAAERGLGTAQNKLAIMYEHGRGLEQDYQQALYWYLQAAKQGYVAAQKKIAVMYQEGRGTAQDYQQAYYWYKKIATKGDKYAQTRLAIIFENGQGVEQDYQQAVYWYKKSAEQGHEEALFYLAKAYEDGKGVKQDYQQAVYWYKKAAETGNTMAMMGLILIYLDAENNMFNVVLAMHWYNLLIQQDLDEDIKTIMENLEDVFVGYGIKE